MSSIQPYDDSWYGNQPLFPSLAARERADSRALAHRVKAQNLTMLVKESMESSVRIEGYALAQRPQTAMGRAHVELMWTVGVKALVQNIVDYGNSY